MEETAALIDELDEIRVTTLALVEGVSDDDLHAVHSPLMSPLVWDLGHIAAFEDLWLVHRAGGEPMLREDLGAIYDAFETPRAQRGDLPMLRRREALEYMDAVRRRARELAERGACDGFHTEMVIQHELQHTETMLQTLGIARLTYHRPPHRGAPPAAPAAGTASGLDTVPVDGGEFLLGAPGLDERFSYDNERPAHRADLPAFRIGRVPVTNGDYLAFVEDGGYGRREWWSEAGWAFRQAENLEHPRGWTGDGREWRLGELAELDPATPVVHVSWFEADAFCRSRGVRLPSEHEWEKAAAWDAAAGVQRPWPWGDDPPGPARANLGAMARGTHPAGAYPEGASPCGALGMLGDVWEWTASEFHGYPGFEAHPYREYSEVFFASGHRVLRGGSWATSPRVATPTFRNWDNPSRRQIFAGFRIAEDA